MKMKVKNQNYVVSLSFANYLKLKNGMPKVIMEHQQMYNKNGISYVYLFSVKKNILHDKVMLFCKFGLIIDGEYMGIYQMSQIIDFLNALNGSGKMLMDIHIHHLMYTNLMRVQELLSAFPNTPVKVYLHDYYNACCNYTLMKNKDNYCGGRGLGEKHCAGCASFQESLITEKSINDLFDKFRERILFISPSQATKEIYSRFHPENADKVIVIPHQHFKENYTGNLEQVKNNERLRIAFLGMPHKHKGWEVWKNIIQNVSDKDYEFIVFNSSDDEYDGMKKVKIAFTENNMNAMTTALRKYKVHIALLWALWPETYSYTCYEAYSANAYLLTDTNSGNIADFVNRENTGKVFRSENELEKFLSVPELVRQEINRYRNQTVGGPAELSANDEIVSLTKRTFNAVSDNMICHKKHKLINYPLLCILNLLYRMNKI